MSDLTLPFKVSDAMYALRDHGSAVGVKGGDVLIQRFVALSDLDETTGDAVTWRRDGRHVSGSFALLITPTNFTGPKSIGNLIVCDDPHRAFFTLMRMVYGDDYEPDLPVELNHFQMGMKSRITSSDSSKAYLEVVVGDGCVITNTTIYDTAIVGSNCAIGGPGFGHVPDFPHFAKHGGESWRVPHIGHVVIEDNVDIGDNTVINRGCLGDTTIRQGVKIDGHVFIAHNVEIGENTMVVAGAVIGGSAKIGKNVWVGMGAQIRDGVNVGDGAVIGMGAVVVKDVPAGVTVIGNPARER